MSRRRAEGDPGVGSDSFLDVIANIVGILIILIVVAGVRVSRAPVAVTPASQPPHQPDAQARETYEVPSLARRAGVPAGRIANPSDSAAEELSAADSLPSVLAAQVDDEPVRINPSPELLAQIANVERELTRFGLEIENRHEPLGRAAASRQDIEGRLTTTEANLAAEAGRLQADQRRLSALKRDADAARSTLADRQTMLNHLERTPPDIRQIPHRLTAVSRTVETREIHFHLQAGRVAYVPVDDLVELLKTDITRQKDWLARIPRHEGRVGPIGGFSMVYVVERQSMSVLDELRVGGTVRLAVSEWRIAPGPDFPSETAAQALSPGSAFIRRLQLIELDTALTFWVYPDSFAEFRQLQELARAEGFTVAARPLPDGTPIAASPQGTRSAGQ